MNKIVKKFKKALQKYYDENERLMCDELIKFAKPKVGEKNLDLLLALLGEKELENMYPKEFVDIKNEFLSKYTVQMSNLCIIDECLVLFDTPFFTLTPELINYFCDIFEFTEAERADILAYFFRKAINVIMSYDTTKHKEIIEKHAKKRLDKKATIFTKLFPKQHMKEEIMNIEKSIAEDKVSCKKLYQIIDDNGNIIPFINALDFSDLMNNLGTPFNNNDILLILNESHKRAMDLEKKEEEAKRSAEMQERIHQERVAKANESKKKSDLLLEQQAIAYRIVKKYLNGNEPLKYMNSEDLLELTSALSILNYTDEDIMKIQKAILSYNNAEENNLLLEKINLAKTTYLTEEQISIIDSAETILNDANALYNHFFEAINDNYRLVIDLLLNINPEDNEETKTLIALGIEDIKLAINSYNMSDYRINSNLKRTINE